jgi:hypothetical protein
VANLAFTGLDIVALVVLAVVLVVTARSPCSGPKIEQRLADVNEFTGDVCQPPFRLAMKPEGSPTSNLNMGGWGEPGEGADPVDGG